MTWSDFFKYEKETGHLLWKVTLSNRALAGSEAGMALNGSGYKDVRLNNQLFRAHRIVFEMHNGAIPNGMEIDHIDGNRENNRIENLRLVSRKENTRNKRLDSRNKSGVHGVYKRPSGYTVSCSKTYVGHYTDFFEACCARKAAERANGYHENHGRKVA